MSNRSSPPSSPLAVDERHTVQLFLGHVERRVDHAERVEDALLQELAERLSGELLDQVALHVDADAVVPARARLGQERQVGQLVDHRLQGFVRVEDALLAVEPVDVVRGAEAVAQTARVRHQLGHRHRALGVHQARLAVGPVAGVHLQVREPGDVARHRVVEAPLALFVEHHQGDAGDRLRHRVDAEDGIALHRRAALDVPDAGHVDVDQLAAARHQGHHAREPAVVDHALHAGGEPFEPLRGDPYVGRIDRFQIARRGPLGRRRRHGQDARREDAHRRERHEEIRQPPTGHCFSHGVTSAVSVTPLSVMSFPSRRGQSTIAW